MHHLTYLDPRTLAGAGPQLGEIDPDELAGLGEADQWAVLNTMDDGELSGLAARLHRSRGRRPARGPCKLCSALKRRGLHGLAAAAAPAKPPAMVPQAELDKCRENLKGKIAELQKARADLKATQDGAAKAKTAADAQITKLSADLKLYQGKLDNTRKAAVANRKRAEGAEAQARSAADQVARATAAQPQAPAPGVGPVVGSGGMTAYGDPGGASPGAGISLDQGGSLDVGGGISPGTPTSDAAPSADAGDVWSYGPLSQGAGGEAGLVPGTPVDDYGPVGDPYADLDQGLSGDGLGFSLKKLLSRNKKTLGKVVGTVVGAVAGPAAGAAAGAVVTGAAGKAGGSSGPKNVKTIGTDDPEELKKKLEATRAASVEQRKRAEAAEARIGNGISGGAVLAVAAVGVLALAAGRRR
jgi:hypothetical protein